MAARGKEAAGGSEGGWKVSKPAIFILIGLFIMRLVKFIRDDKKGD